jgi:hypothetical protein
LYSFQKVGFPVSPSSLTIKTVAGSLIHLDVPVEETIATVKQLVAKSGRMKCFTAFILRTKFHADQKILVS